MFPAMFARWFIANSEAFRTKGVKFVHNAPYILMRLAGLKGKDAFIDWGAMSGWGLGYDVQKKCWSEEQLHILGIDPQYMPTIRKPWDIVGGLCEAMSVRTGLPAGIPILAGAGDTMQSMLGSGVFEANQGVDVAGTCAMFCVSTSGSSLIQARCPTHTSIGDSCVRAACRFAGSKTMWLVTRVTAATTALSPKELPKFLPALAAYSSSLTLRADTAKRKRQAGASST